MTAFNIVRMVVKPGEEEEFLAIHGTRGQMVPPPGMRSLNVVQTGEREYFVIGQWDGMEALAAARPQMIEFLGRFRDKLEDLGETGVTQPWSGTVVQSLP